MIVALGRSEAILKAVALSARSFAGDVPWQEVLSVVLRGLGTAAEVSRVYVFENLEGLSGELLMDERFEWCATGIAPTIDDPSNHHSPYLPDYERWMLVLGGGQVIAGPADSFPPVEKADLDEEFILSTAFVPIFVADEWWGYLGFDDCVEARAWSALELTALEAAADTLGAAINRERIGRQLDQAEARFRAHVEHLPAITYIEYSESSSTLGYEEVYLSPQFETILGYPVEKWFEDTDGTWWGSLMSPEDAAAVEAEARRTAETGEPYRMDYRVRHADGHDVWIRDECFLVQEGEERPYWHGVMMDITERKEMEEQLREAELKFRTLVEQIPAVLYIDDIGPSNETIYVGPQLESIVGVKPEAWMADPELWSRVVHPEDAPRAVEEYEQWVSGGGEGQLIQEYRMIHPGDGHIIWIRDDGTLLRDEHGAPKAVQGVMYDVTQLKMAIEHAREAEKRLRAIIEQVPAVVYLDPLDENELSMYISPQVESILGCTPEEWLGDPSWWHSHLHPDDSDRVWDAYLRHREMGEGYTQEYRMVRDDGRIVWIREDATVLPDDEGKPWVIQGLFYDVTERKVAEAQIAFLAYHDKLTGLTNRAMLEEMLEPALARARRTNRCVALLFMDLDGFKEINDTLGHDAGDRLLKQVADRLVEATRETDLVARQGGDEFLIMLADLESGDGHGALHGQDDAVRIAETMAERIHTLMRAPFPIGDEEVHASISIGLSVFPRDAVDGRSLLKNSDAAMYESKKARRGDYREEPGNEAVGR